MRLRKRYAISIFFAFLVASMLPAAARTAILARDYVGLITIASLSEEDFSFFPWKRDSVLVSPNMAVTILARFDWPYSVKDPKLSPPLHQAVTAHVLVDTVPNDSARIIQLITALLDRGEFIDEYDGSYTPLLLAILHCDEKIVRLLVARGADISLPFRKVGSPAYGLNATDFAGFLSAKENYCSSGIHPFLKSRTSSGY